MSDSTDKCHDVITKRIEQAQSIGVGYIIARNTKTNEVKLVLNRSVDSFIVAQDLMEFASEEFGPEWGIEYVRSPYNNYTIRGKKV